MRSLNIAALAVFLGGAATLPGCTGGSSNVDVENKAITAIQIRPSKDSKDTTSQYMVNTISDGPFMDVNGDGKQDLLFYVTKRGTFPYLLFFEPGNGDGTFGKPKFMFRGLIGLKNAGVTYIDDTTTSRRNKYLQTLVDSLYNAGEL